MIPAAPIASAPSGDLVLSHGSAAAGGKWLTALIGALRQVMRGARQLGPYAAIELLLPGGSLVAIALWLYRRNRLSG
jgi:hypothetical protein